MQTITVREAESQLQSLVKEAQLTHLPVILTNDAAAPVAVLTPFVDLQTEQNDALSRRLEIIESVIQMWLQQHSDPNVSRDAAQLLQGQLRQISVDDGIRSPAFGALVMLLRLATRQVRIPTPQNQVQAFALGVSVLHSNSLDWNDVERVDQGLLASGIDARANFGDEELLKAYVDAS